VEKNQSGGPKKSGGGGRPMPPDFGGRVKKGKKGFPFNNLASLNLDFGKKLLKKVKKVARLIWQAPTVRDKQKRD
jgi:hypothetical protein